MKRLAVLLMALPLLRCGVQPEGVLSGEARAQYLQEIGIEKILLTDAKEDGRHLYVLDNKSTRARRLTTTPALRIGSWSPDGRRIAFIEGNGLNVMKEDGTEIKQVAAFSQAPILLFKWSPDGALIAFRAGAPSGTIYTVRPDGGGLTSIDAPWVITSGQFNNPGDLAWAPDGRLLAYEARYTGDSVPQVYLTKPDGSGRRRLTSTPVAARNPSWSPDGLKIAFDSDTTPYVINVDGTGQKQITNTFALAPIWSPRGDVLAYRSLNGSIGIMNPDGTERRQVVGLNSGESALFHSWSPDGSRIVFVGVSGDVVSMYVVRTSGNDLRSIVDDLGSFDVKWSR